MRLKWKTKDNETNDVNSAYTMRAVLNISITEMVYREGHDAKIRDNTCPAPGGEYVEERLGFEWSEKLQGVILGAFFWGYVRIKSHFFSEKHWWCLWLNFQAATHVPGGVLAAKYGGKYVLSLGILSTAIFTLITPVVIQWGKVSVCLFVRW